MSLLLAAGSGLPGNFFGGQFFGGQFFGGDVPPTPPAPGGADGDNATWIRKQNRARDVKFQEERERKDELRQLLKRALDPVADEASVELVAVDDGVVVIPAAGPAVAVPLPEGIDLDALAEAIGRILAEAQVQAERTQRAQAQEIARVALERAREEASRLRRRRREEEILLLM
jgi:hypothetical protein